MSEGSELLQRAAATVDRRLGCRLGTLASGALKYMHDALHDLEAPAR